MSSELYLDVLCLGRVAPSGEWILTRAIPERIRGGLRRCALQIDLYLLTLLYSRLRVLLTLKLGEAVKRIKVQDRLV